jgi:uncharacterized protein involved in outer membrane biogenesis
MKKLVRIFLVLVLLLIVAGVLAVFFIGNIVKRGVEKVGPMVTKVSVKLDAANISVFNGSGELKGFVLGNPAGFKSSEAVKVGTISLSLVPKSVLGDKVVIHSIKIEGPEINYETDLKGDNLRRIMDNISSGEKAPSKQPGESKPTEKSKGAQRKLQVDEFVITGAKVHATAPIVGTYTVLVPEIKLPPLGQGPEGITVAELSQKVMSAVLEAASKAAADGLSKAGKEGAGDMLKKGASGIGDLLKKK